MNTTPVIIPPEPELTLIAQRKTLTEAEARTLTTHIQRTTVRLWMLVTEAHDRRAHQALGYASWDDYVKAELKMSPSRSYQLLDTGHVMVALAKGGADLEEVTPPPARIVSRVKNRLGEVQKVTRRAIRDGEDPAKAVRALAREARPPEPVEPPPPVAASGRPPVLVVCPACSGEGKVSRTMSRRLQAFLRK